MRIFRRNRLRWLLGLIALMGSVSVAALYAMRSRPVLWAPYNKNETVSIGGPSFSILNPLRDRTPERPAEALLGMLKVSECEKALETVPFDREYRSYICGRETDHRLLSWRMTDREDSPEKVKMFYWANRGESAGLEAPMWVTVERRGAAWQVTDFECWY